MDHTVEISFSVRLENIVNITNALISRGSNAVVARQDAKHLEEEILKHSDSEKEYQQLCAELFTVPVEPASVRSELEPGEEILNPDGPVYGDYTCATFHKDGQMSTMYKARAANDSADVTIVALKITIPAQMQPPHNVHREARILAQLKHEHIITLLQSFWHRDRFILVFPFMRQDLENLLRSGSLTHKQAHMVFTGLFSALAHLHSLGIIHRDVKPSNILLREMNGPVFLADFGIAWSPADPESETAGAKISDVGTTSYRPPELLFGDHSYGTSLDMWAAGCVVSEMVRENHHQLFNADPLGSELGLIKSIFTTLGTPTVQTWPSVVNLPDWGKVRFQDFQAQDWGTILPGASPQALDFVQTTVCYESSARLTAIQALEHALSSEFADAV